MLLKYSKFILFHFYSSGLVSVPITLNNIETNENEEAVIIAGMVGYKVHTAQIRKIGINVSIEPVHGWSLYLESDSELRTDLIEWEERISG